MLSIEAKTMIISHKHKYIFIKTIKTAGTSMEIGLSKYCGNSDVLTDIGAVDDKLRESLGHKTTQNERIPISQFSKSEWKKFLKRGTRKKYTKHMGATEIRKYTSSRIWNTYYKFCFERNPWDKVVSYYHWRNHWEKRDQSDYSISEFVDSDRVKYLAQNSSEAYLIDDKIAVDRVYRFENLDESLRDIEKVLGLPGDVILPNAKGNIRKDKRGYREILNTEDKEKIEQIFGKVIQLHGYQF